MKKETHSKIRAMSNGYKHHHHHHHQNIHHHHHHNQNIHHTTATFLPLLCKASTQDIKVQQVVLPKFSGDPSSPRVSCIGHVKRSNKVTGFPTPTPKPPAAAAANTQGSSRRPIPNSTYSHFRPAAPTHKPRLNKSNAASPPPLTTTVTLGGCGQVRGPILNPNYSALVAGLIHKTSSNKPIPSPRTPIAAATTAAATATTGVRRPARGLILNSNYSTLRAGSWVPLNTTTATTAEAGKSNFKYTKLKIPYLCKNLSEPINGYNCRSRDTKMVNCTVRRSDFSDGSDRNYDVELDRPLPVVKKVKEPGFDREEVNLWKRRSNGFELKSNLKIQQIHVGNYNHYQTPTTV